MLFNITFDQLRTFIVAADEGSFSAAGRKLCRAQSVVSQALANLEAQIGVKLFDRSARYPRLTEQGRNLLAEARAVAESVEVFKARARAVSEGLEPEPAGRTGMGSYAPLHMVRADLDSGALVKIRAEGHAARSRDADESSIPQERATRTCSPQLYRSTQVLMRSWTRVPLRKSNAGPISANPMEAI